MMSHRIERDPKTVGQILGRSPVGALELDQNCASQALPLDRVGSSFPDEPELGIHVRNHK
jgi:hypothetical protein